jgi:hypothetical protein
MEKNDWRPELPTGPTTKRKRAKLKFAKMRESKSRWRDKVFHHQEVRSLKNTMTQPIGGDGAAQLGVTKPGVVCNFVVLRVTNETKQGLQVFRLVQRASGPRNGETKYFKKPRGSGRLGNDGEGSDVQSGGKYDFILSDATLQHKTAMSTNSTTILHTEESKTEYKNGHTIT